MKWPIKYIIKKSKNLSFEINYQLKISLKKKWIKYNENKVFKNDINKNAMKWYKYQKI